MSEENMEGVTLTAGWICRLQQLNNLLANGKPGIFAPPSEKRAFKRSAGELIKLLRINLKTLQETKDAQAFAACANIDIAEIEYLSALSRAMPECHAHDAQIRDLCSRLLRECKLPEDVRLKIMTTGLAAALDSPSERVVWINSVKATIAQHLIFTPNIAGLAYNYVMALAISGLTDEALAAARLLDPALPDARLLMAGLLAPASNKHPCLYFLKAYFGETTKKKPEDVIVTLRQQVARYKAKGRALVLLAWGHQGVYALVWSYKHAHMPLYLSVLNWDAAQSLRIRCARLPWAHFLDLNRFKKPEKLEFTPDDYVLLQELWGSVLKPVMEACGHDASAIDIIPIGWLALVPWVACGKDPDQGQYAGLTTSFAILPEFSFLEETSNCEPSAPHRERMYLVRGDYSGDIESACKAEESALVDIGFTVIEQREEVLNALRSGVAVHFNGHGKFPAPTEPGPGPHFKLRDGSELTIQDLQAAAIESTPPLISFSSCELGFCYFSNGLPHGFPGWFLCKGTIACIAPLGEIKADVAAEYFPAFYEKLLSGHTVGCAVKSALAKRTKAGQGKRNLGYWSPIIVYGDQWLKICEGDARSAHC